MGSTEKHTTASTAARAPSERGADFALIKRVRQGDRSAFDLLMIKYQYKIIKLIMRYVGGSSEVLDVAQVAFLKAYRAAPSFRGDSAFSLSISGRQVTAVGEVPNRTVETIATSLRAQ